MIFEKCQQNRMLFNFPKFLVVLKPVVNFVATNILHLSLEKQSLKKKVQTHTKFSNLLLVTVFFENFKKN